MNNGIRRIAICTGGGDAPGLNAVIRAATISALDRGWEVYGIREGFNGIFFPERYPEGGVFRLTRDRVRGITHLGGTILGTFLAAWLLVIVTTGMIVADWLPAYHLCVLGVLLIVSIIATNLIYSRTER